MAKHINNSRTEKYGGKSISTRYSKQELELARQFADKMGIDLASFQRLWTIYGFEICRILDSIGELEKFFKYAGVFALRRPIHDVFTKEDLPMSVKLFFTELTEKTEKITTGDGQ